ncbi:DrmB family protein [Nonomuraea sp. NPDC004297]
MIPMISGKVRRSQFVAPFGPGAMQVLPDGTSVITAGLDHWFPPSDTLDQEEFRIHEWRLERHLGVTALYTPPDYRNPNGRQKGQYNTGLSVPVLRFPAWSFCPRCRGLSQDPLFVSERPRCANPNCPAPKGSRRPYLAQVPFVAMCERGHLRDFPWNEWVHSSAQPACGSPRLKLITSGGGTLASQYVICQHCDKRRSLAGITSVESGSGHEAGSTVLTRKLDSSTSYVCQGAMPWLGLETQGQECGAPLRGSLRGASNVYYALLKSSIFIPEQTTGIAPAVFEALEERTIARVRANARDLLEPGERLTAARLRKAAKKNSFRLENFTDTEIDAALIRLESPTVAPSTTEAAPEDATDQAPFRYQEFERIRDVLDSAELVIRLPKARNAPDIAALIPRIRLVEKLRETRVLAGFNRIFAESGVDSGPRITLLRRRAPADGLSWLPAYTVQGEGIYLELDSERLQRWERDQNFQTRLSSMVKRFRQMAQDRHLADRDISPRLILLHTLAHLLINQLVYECGYSSASLRERLYVSPGEHGMCGLLIYTAAGDSEGTLGGLVRMGQPDRFDDVLRNAIFNARWCSSDPVCMESRGQGPDSCNLAACHSCALLPETACEEFNRFLDRGLVAGTANAPDLGFFSGL